MAVAISSAKNLWKVTVVWFTVKNVTYDDRQASNGDVPTDFVKRSVEKLKISDCSPSTSSNFFLNAIAALISDIVQCENSNFEE